MNTFLQNERELKDVLNKIAINSFLNAGLIVVLPGKPLF
jgi:hypothetical protein